MPQEPHRLPATPADWESRIHDAGLQGSNFSTIADLSNQEHGVSLPQYLLIRVLFTNGGSPGDLHRTWKDFVAEERYEQSALSLRTSRGWSRYLIALCSDSRHNEIPKDMNQYSIARICLTTLGKRLKHSSDIEVCNKKGTNSKIRSKGNAVAHRNGLVNLPSIPIEADRPKSPFYYLQRGSDLIYSTGFPVPPIYRSLDSFAPSADEIIVASTLLEFLNAIARECDTRGHWVLIPTTLALSKHSKDLGGIDVRVNGLFSPAMPGCESSVESLALFDASPHVRARDDNRVQMQEAAQIAALLLNQPQKRDKSIEANKIKNNVLVSQHLHEIYLTFAQYDHKYIDYLHGHITTSQASFLRLSQFGPFSISSAAEIEILVPVLMAWHLMVSGEEHNTGEKEMWNDPMDLCSETDVNWLGNLDVSDNGYHDDIVHPCHH